MVNMELQFEGADLDDTEEAERPPSDLAPEIAERFERVDSGIQALGDEIGRLAQAVDAWKASSSGVVPAQGEASVSQPESGPFQQMALVVEMVREAAERTPRETKAAAVGALGPEVQRLAETIDMRLQGLGNAVRALDQSRISIEQHVLEIRRKHEAALAIRENWALIALFGGGALSLINLVTLALFWLSRS